MTQVLAKQGRVLLALLAVLAIAVAACGSSSGTKAPGSSATPGISATPDGSASAKPSTGGGGGLTDAGSKFADIDSYKFSMTILDESITGSLSTLTGGDAGAAMTFAGTVIVKPEPAADLKIGTLRIVEIAGKQYIDLGTGTFISTAMDPGEEGLASSFSPGKMFDSFVGASQAKDYEKAGSGQKNGVNADHYAATEAALAQFAASQPDIKDATWTSDVWIASDGGYPVSFSAIATKAGSPVWEIVFEVMSVNDAANKVTAPAA